MKPARRAATLGIAVALALILSYVESLVPISAGVPGIKIGLPNIVIVFILYRIGGKDAAAVSLMRVLLVSLLFGNFAAFIYSVSGAVLSLAGMILLKKTNAFSCVGVSVAGALLHNAGQIAAAALLMRTSEIAYYMPVLAVTGTVSGIAVGIAGGILLKRVRL